MGLRNFSAKQIASAWGLSRDTQATQAFDPWAEKTARLALRFPAQFLALVSELMQDLERQQHEPMPEPELRERELFLAGIANRRRF